MQNFTGKDNSHKESVQKAKGFLLYCKAQNKTCSCFSAPFLVIGTPREDGRGVSSLALGQMLIRHCRYFRFASGCIALVN